MKQCFRELLWGWGWGSEQRRQVELQELTKHNRQGDVLWLKILAHPHERVFHFLLKSSWQSQTATHRALNIRK